MNLKNLEYIKSGLRELGFGDKLPPELEAKIAQGKPRCSFLHKTRFNDLEMSSAVHLEKSDQSDKYRITKYDAMVKKEPDFNDNKVHTFYINKNNGVSLKEAFNLLEGRSVLKPIVAKDGTTENNWLQLDFTRMDKTANYLVNKYGTTHGFDLEKTLAGFSIREMKTAPAKEMLIRSLQKGNLEQVTIVKGGMQEKVFVEANPAAKTVNVYTTTLKKVEKETLDASQAIDQPKQEARNNQSGSLVKRPKNELAGGGKHESKSRRKGLSH